MTELLAIRPAGFADCVRAEWFGLRRRPGVLLMAAIWAVQVIVFAYLVVYLVYRSTGSQLPAADAERMLGALLPGGTDSFIVGSLPLYGGPVMLAIGAVVASGDYRLGTLRTLLSRYANRRVFLLARFTGLALVLLAVATLTLLLSLAGSTVIAQVESRPLDYPGVGALAGTLGAIWLIVIAWGSLGFMLGTLTRNVVGAVAIGLGWTLGVETLLVGGLAGAVPAFDALRVALLSPSSGSLAAALGAVGGSNGTPGVVSTASGPVAAALLVGYTVVPLLVALVVFRRRDIA